MGLLTRRPCATCAGTDQLHQGLTCMNCKTPTPLLPIDVTDSTKLARLRKAKQRAKRAGEHGGRPRKAHYLGVALTVRR